MTATRSATHRWCKHLDASKVSDESVKLSLTNDTSKLADAVQGLVDQYNSLMSFIGENLSVGDPSSRKQQDGALELGYSR